MLGSACQLPAARLEAVWALAGPSPSRYNTGALLLLLLMLSLARFAATRTRARTRPNVVIAILKSGCGV